MTTATNALAIAGVLWLLLVGGARKFRFQSRLYGGPFRVQNAEVDRVPPAAVPRHHMLAERAFFFGAKTQDGGTRALIHRIRLEFNPQALPLFERMPQHQVFRLGVDRGALPGGRDPRGTDFHSAVGQIHVHKSRAANYAP